MIRRYATGTGALEITIHMRAEHLPERILVMGLGVHGGGLGVARWLLRHGIHVTVTDLASPEALEKPLALLEQAASESTQGRVEYVLGHHRPQDFTTHDMVVANPAVPPDSPWLALAHDAGIPVETEMTLFFRLCPGPILGITGTKGKTTTALITGSMLRQRYPDTVIAGNLRVSALESLDEITPDTPVVLELSSFQLQAMGRLAISPPYACITNFSPDHLNYHQTMDAYAHAKQQIFVHQNEEGILILNADDPESRRFAEVARPGTIRTYSTNPQSNADCFLTREGTIVFRGETIYQKPDIQLVGQHNLANMLAATALVCSFGLAPSHIQAAVRLFRGVEHRMEFVRTLHGVQYINDTTATNPSATLAALSSVDAPVVLIAGGADKGIPFGDLPNEIVRRTRALILLHGSATPWLESEIRNILNQKVATVPTVERTANDTPSLLRLDTIYGPFDTLDKAVQVAQNCAVAGDVVVLSPACASFGMFHNEFHRGEEFRRIVTTVLT